MLQDPIEAERIFDVEGAIKPYNGPGLFGSARRYHDFVRRLSKSGLLRFTRKPLEMIGIFFVWKKERKAQRMTLDCRRSNRMFRDAPHVNLLTSEGFAHFEVLADWSGPSPSWPAMFIGVADVRDAFHRLLMPPELSPRFCFEPVGVGALGFAPDLVEGSQARAGTSVYPCARALPMGFTWSLFFCQSLGLHMMGRATGLEGDEALSDFRGCGIFGGSVVSEPPRHYVYVDNIGVMGCRRKAVAAGLGHALEEFESRGLVMHESGVYGERCEVLGLEIDRVRHRSSVGLRRLWRLRRATDWLLRRGRSDHKTMLGGHSGSRHLRGPRVSRGALRVPPRVPRRPGRRRGADRPLGLGGGGVHGVPGAPAVGGVGLAPWTGLLLASGASEYGFSIRE